MKEYIEMEEDIKKSSKCCGIYYVRKMETYCVSCKKNNTNKNSSFRITRQNRLMWQEQIEVD